MTEMLDVGWNSRWRERMKLEREVVVIVSGVWCGGWRDVGMEG